MCTLINKERIKLTLILFICFFSFAVTKGQGIYFTDFVSENNSKNNCQIFFYKTPTYKSYFKVKFDLAICDYKSIGYIFRLSDQNDASSPLYNFTFSYDDEKQSYLKFNLEGVDNLTVDTLWNDNLGRRKWIPILMEFNLESKFAKLIIGNKNYELKNLNLWSSFKPSLLFGAKDIQEESPEFAIKNLSIEGDGGNFYFPLNEYSGNILHDSLGNKIGKSINPKWLSSSSYHWENVFEYHSSTISGCNFLPVKNELIIFNLDSIIRYDFQQRELKQAKFNSTLNMDIILGASFIDTLKSEIYVYELARANKSTPMIEKLDLMTLNWTKQSDASVLHQRHQHASYFDNVEKKLYVFGGFGSRKYFNELLVYSIEDDTWTKIPLQGDTISPRFFSSIGRHKDDCLLLFGGIGNQSGDQTVGKVFYYDLYEIDLKQAKVKKIRNYDIGNQEDMIIPVRELIYSKQENTFYTLCYSTKMPISELQLYKFHLNNDNFEILGDAIPFESRSILTNANLFYNGYTNEFYCSTFEFDPNGGQNSTIKLYSIDAPVLSSNFFVENNESNIKWILILLIVILGTGAYLLYRIAKHKKQINTKNRGVIENNNHEIAPEITDLLDQAQELENENKNNSIYIFGDFCVFDKKSRDITYMFPLKIRQLFIFILLHSYPPNEGIDSNLLQSIIWSDKSSKASKNLKGVTISKLRKVLTEFDGISLTFVNGSYKLEIDMTICFCDFFAIKDLMSDESLNSKSVIKILNRGKFLKNSDEDIFDKFKEEIDEKTINYLLVNLNSNYISGNIKAIKTSSLVLLNIDRINEIAIWYYIYAHTRLNENELAINRFNIFSKEYKKALGEDYPFAFNEISTIPLSDFIKRIS